MVNRAADSAQMACAYGGPLAAVEFKQRPQDFLVDELLPFAPTGAGHHWLVQVEKTACNTLDLLDQLAREWRIPRRSFGYSGLKDRQAVTRQWISVPAQGLSESTLESCETDSWRVLQYHRHQRKLRVGSHQQNRFTINLPMAERVSTAANRQDVTVDKQQVDERLGSVSRFGVPNYFGPQRFGRSGSNLHHARRLFFDAQKLGRQQHRFSVSAARSYGFNLVLSRRIEAGCWDSFVAGDAVSLDGSNSWFAYERLDENAEQRLRDFDIHPSGPLWGTGELPTSDRARLIEEAALSDYVTVCKGLQALGLKQERRALRARVSDMDWSWRDNELAISFTLAKGGFATAVLREIFTHAEFSLPFSPLLQDEAQVNQL